MLNLRMDTNINLRQRKDVHDININENNMRYLLCVLLEHRGSWITHWEYTPTNILTKKILLALSV